MAPLLAQRARSDRAFERLYQRYVGDVYRYTLALLRNPADAEDVTQTTFMNAYRAYARGERPHTPQNWLIAIAHNVCRQRFRQQQRRPNELPLEDDEVAQVVPDDDTPSAEDIRRALSHLAFNQRAALVMRELEGRSYAEIAEVLQLSTSAVETLIFRARRALREQLEGGLTCREAEFAISRQLDGKLPRKERGALRAHLRECEDCARFARSQRAQRSAIRALALIPVPSSLTSFFHHGGSVATAGAGAAAGGGVAMKAALVSATTIVATGVGVEAAHKAGFHPLRKDHATAQRARSTAAGARAAQVRAAPVRERAVPAARTRAEPASATAKPLHGRLKAEAVTKELHGRLKAEGRTAIRGNESAPGQLKKPARVKPAHPVKKLHPVHPAKPSNPKPETRKKQPPPPPARHEAKPKPQPKEKEPKPASSTPTETVTTTTEPTEGAPSRGKR